MAGTVVVSTVAAAVHVRVPLTTDKEKQRSRHLVDAMNESLGGEMPEGFAFKDASAHWENTHIQVELEYRGSSFPDEFQVTTLTEVIFNNFESGKQLYQGEVFAFA